MSRTFLMFFLAVALAVAAAFLANNWLEKQRLATEQSVVAVLKTAPVVVAAVEIPFGATIGEQHLKVEQIPEKAVPGKAFQNIEEVTGKLSKQTIYAGEVLREERVANRNELGGGALAALLPPNMRAVTVRVNDVIGVAGFLLPGDYVDILGSRKRSTDKMETRIVLERIKVLAVDQTAASEKNEPVIVRAVTLEVTPEQAEKLVDAINEGQIQLALRNPTDELILAKIPEKEAPLPPPPVAEPPPPPEPEVVYKVIYREPAKTSVTVIRGGQKGISIGSSDVPR